jgi:hypothetical protein
MDRFGANLCEERDRIAADDPHALGKEAVEWIDDGL